MKSAPPVTVEPLAEIHPGTPGWGTVWIYDVTVLRETDKAVQVARGGKNAWLPKTAVSLHRSGYFHEKCDLTVKVWFYLKVYKQL